MTRDQEPINPYAPSHISDQSPEPRRALSGYRRGVRNGVLWSLPSVVALTLANYGYTQSITHGLANGLLVIIIWCTAAGIVAELSDRRKQ